MTLGLIEVCDATEDDPRRKGQFNHNDGGRGTYFRDPDGHLLEIITRPYGSG